MDPNEYGSRVLMGNWQEDAFTMEENDRELLSRKAEGEVKTQKTQHALDFMLDKVFLEEPSIKWEYFNILYKLDRMRSLRVCPKITTSHLQLNSSSKMRVRLSVQVLEDSLAWLDSWEGRIADGKIAKEKFLTDHTLESLQLTIKSTTDLTIYLVEKFGFQYVLTGKINQDALEVDLSQHEDCIRYGSIVQLSAPDLLTHPTSGSEKRGLTLSCSLSAEDVASGWHLADGCLLSAAPHLSPVVRNSFVVTSEDGREKNGEPLCHGENFTLRPAVTKNGKVELSQNKDCIRSGSILQLSAPNLLTLPTSVSKKPDPAASSSLYAEDVAAGWHLANACHLTTPHVSPVVPNSFVITSVDGRERKGEPLCYGEGFSLQLAVPKSEEVELSQLEDCIRYGCIVQLLAPDLSTLPTDGSEKQGLALSCSLSAEDIGSGGQLSDGCLLSAAPDLSPVVRNCFVITSSDGRQRNGEPLCYGESFTLRPVVTKNGERFYVQSMVGPIDTPVGHSGQPILQLSTKGNYYTRWHCLHIDPNLRPEKSGCPVKPNEKLVINHSATNRRLAVEHAHWINTLFGMECEVTLHTYLDAHKREMAENIWMIVTKTGGENK